MRGAGEYALADKLRDALVEAGIEVHDTPAGSTWDLAAPQAG
jgi:cysteinyl-tRNA synthetase